MKTGYIGGGKSRNAFGRLLLRRGITSDDLAKMLKCHVQAVRSWRGLKLRNGRLVPTRTPKHKTLVRIAKKLRIDKTRTLTGAQRVLRLIRTPVS